MAIGGEFTARLLTDSGIGAGMRVLDVGCGAGDVSLIAAGLVGAGGSVLGIDRDSAPLEAARERVAEAGLANVAFKRCDLNDLPADLGVFDAIVGRRVLMYLADPVGVVREVYVVTFAAQAFADRRVPELGRGYGILVTVAADVDGGSPKPEGIV